MSDATSTSSAAAVAVAEPQAPAPEPRRRRPAVPRPLAWLLVAVAVLGVAWVLVVPPFQAPDENSHFGYLQHLAETGDLPGDPNRPPFSTEQTAAAQQTGADQAAAQKPGRLTWSAREAEQWRAQSFTDAQRSDGGGPNPAASNPPLYYLSVAPAYLATSSSGILTRLTAARLFGLLWLLVTVTATWLLAGEILGRRRPLQLVAAGVAGLQPMVVFVSSSITPDAALYATWTLALWLGVRTIRRGATPGTATALAAATAAAILVKSTSYALLPGVALALLVGLWRTWRTSPRGAAIRRAALTAAPAAVALAVPLAVWWSISRGLQRAATGQLSGASTELGMQRIREFLSYVWQFYLPRPGFLNEYDMLVLPLPVWEYWVKGAWASFGWLEVRLPIWAYWIIAAGMVAVIAGAIAAIVRARHRIDWFVALFVVLVMGTLLGGLHWTDYNFLENPSRFIQGRYILPLIGLFGVAAAAAVSVVPRARRGLAAGGLLGVLLTLQLLCLATTMTRFYA